MKLRHDTPSFRDDLKSCARLTPGASTGGMTQRQLRIQDTCCRHINRWKPTSFPTATGHVSERSSRSLRMCAAWNLCTTQPHYVAGLGLPSPYVCSTPDIVTGRMVQRTVTHFVLLLWITYQMETDTPTFCKLSKEQQGLYRFSLKRQGTNVGITTLKPELFCYPLYNNYTGLYGSLHQCII